MLKVEEIKSVTDCQNYVEGCLNDLMEGISTKKETMKFMLYYTLKIAEQARPILLSNYLSKMSEHFTVERGKKRIMDKDKNTELVNHIGSALTVIECEVKKDLKTII